ncbi:hypothetical protein PHMEG_00027803 [Phytophthora megakarya]|uniref:Uncharacterized protein n=1 Tax=Phytophthora megakarya TaxID=4795 RepID=A0A225V829_9STRA|nr:hypothetical protein PHMEG_00027803 [Phytophthora megakarya]
MAVEFDGLLLLETKVTNARASTISANSRASYLGSTFSTYAGHRSAFFNLYQDYHRVMSAGLEREMSAHSKGLQRQVAGAISQGQIKVGKYPMSFGLYKQVVMAMLQSTSRDMIFSRTFKILSWNLMYRAANTVSICYGHLVWRDDALCIYFAHMTNDLRGTRPRDPRHVYANPISPEIGLILALGKSYAFHDIVSLQLLRVCFEKQVYIGLPMGLIPTTLTFIRAMMSTNDLEKPLISVQSYSVVELQLTTLERIRCAKEHQLTANRGRRLAPPSVAVHLRAGWSMGGVQDRYHRHDAAGDMFVGRTVSGHPVLQPEFAILPPHFTTSDEEVQRAKEIYFPGLPQIVGFVAKFALASLIYHIDFLRQKLSNDHPLFQSPLFTDAELIPQLRSRVQCDSNNGEMQPTGVPPHVKILSELLSVRSEVKEAVQLRNERHKTAYGGAKRDV